jgi:hypothetical protein
VRGYDNLIDFIKLESREDKENKKYYEYLTGHFKAYGFIPLIYAEKELSIEETASYVEAFNNAKANIIHSRCSLALLAD